MKRYRAFPLSGGIIPGVIFLLAVALRVLGNRHGLPWIEEPDLDTVRLASRLVEGDASLESLLHPTRYPHLLFYVYVPLLKLFPGADMIWIGRVVSGMLGAGTVFFAYLCGNLAHSRGAGCLAGCLTAFSFLGVQHAHLAKPHVPVAFFTIACVYYCMRIMQDPRPRNYVFAGLLGGASAATLHSGLIVVAGLLAAVMLKPSEERLFSWRRYLAPGPMILVGLLAAFILIGYPNRIAALIEILKGNAGWADLMAPHGPEASKTLGIMGFVRTAFQFIQNDPSITLLGGLAFLWGFWKRPSWWRLCWPGFAMVLLFLAVFGHVRVFAPRFFILLLPVLAVAGASWIAALTSRLKPSIARPAFLTAFAVSVLPGSAMSCKLVTLYLEDDTRVQAVRWIQENVPEGDTLAAVPYLDFPLPLTRASIENHREVLKNLPHFEAQTLRRMSRGEEPEAGPGRYTVFFPFKDSWKAGVGHRKEILEKSGARYAVSVFYAWREYNDPLFNVFKDLGEVVFRARPGKGAYCGGNLYLIQNPLMNLWSIERPGPLVEVVKL